MTKPCEVCGADFRVKPSHYDLRHTCSVTCQSKRQRGNQNARKCYCGECDYCRRLAASMEANRQYRAGTRVPRGPRRDGDEARWAAIFDARYGAEMAAYYGDICLRGRSPLAGFEEGT